MLYSPPLVKPPLSPLRPPAPFPFRPPGPNQLPPTQTAPIFSPPTLLPPTDRDLRGIICIYANTPIWEPKKIRYRYPGNNWQEIEGETYSIDYNEGWNPLPLQQYQIIFSARFWCWHTNRGQIVTWANYVEGGFRLEEATYSKYPNDFNDWRGGIYRYTGELIKFLRAKIFILWDKNGSNKRRIVGPYNEAVEYEDFTCDNTYMPDWVTISASITDGCAACWVWPYITLTLNTAFHNINDPLRGYACKWGSIKIDRVIRVSDNQEIPPNNCTFKVFNIFNQNILEITRDTCPEVAIIPERCYYKAENERLVRKLNIGILQNLRTEYNGNCATVWLDAPPLPFATEIYKECSDSPSCPPPRIRFDKKCEEKCEQCPPGTAIKVLLGGNIACVNFAGCVMKTVKYKPGCNSYDCICN